MNRWGNPLPPEVAGGRDWDPASSLGG